MSSRPHHLPSTAANTGFVPRSVSTHIVSLNQSFCFSVLTLLSLASVALLPFQAKAQDNQPDELKIIELFTSHGCSSCPPAEKLLSEFLEEYDNLLALEFHVDYWDDLVHGRDGNFVDPFSQAAHSERQREYNVNKLKGRPGVYTPQAIVNGRMAAVGSNRRDITKELNRSVEQLLQVHIESMDVTNTLSIRIDGNEEQLEKLRNIDIKMASYIDEATTEITGGENRNKTLHNKNIVTSLDVLGKVKTEAPMMFSIPQPEEGRGCIIFVQQAALTPIFAASACP